MGENHECHCKPCGEEGHMPHVEEHCHCKEKFLKFADEAWAELLKDKIKANIEKEHGEHITKLAEIVSKANGEKWKHKISIKVKKEEYENSLKEFFASKDK